MDVISCYNDYLTKFEKGETSNFFFEEISVLEVLETYSENIPTGQFYILNITGEGGRIVLLKVEYDGKKLRILEGLFLENALMNIANSFYINNHNEAIRWWNLCYHCDKHGKVKYDSYYDKYYAANETEKKMSDLQREIAKWIEDSFVGVEGLIYILGDLSNNNPIIYQLQQKGLEVKIFNNSKSLAEVNEHIIKQRERLAIPYCDAGLVTVGFLTSNGIEKCPAECHRSYLITIPIDLININDNAVGSFSYKDILPSEGFCRDYSCCGHNYCYVEMELFADLYGNTVLKTTNSKAESKYTIINKFNYTNPQKNGQSN